MADWSIQSHSHSQSYAESVFYLFWMYYNSICIPYSELFSRELYQSHVLFLCKSKKGMYLYFHVVLTYVRNVSRYRSYSCWKMIFYLLRRLSNLRFLLLSKSYIYPFYSMKSNQTLKIKTPTPMKMMFLMLFITCPNWKCSFRKIMGKEG